MVMTNLGCLCRQGLPSSNRRVLFNRHHLCHDDHGDFNEEDEDNEIKVITIMVILMRKILMIWPHGPTSIP